MKIEYGKSYLHLLPVGVLVMLLGLPLSFLVHPGLIFTPLLAFNAWKLAVCLRSGVFLDGKWKAAVSKSRQPDKFLKHIHFQVAFLAFGVLASFMAANG